MKIILILMSIFFVLGCSSNDNPVDKNNNSNEKILFHQKIGGKYQIFSMNPDGSDKAVVIEREHDCSWAKYSPDNSKIAFCEKDGDEYSFTFYNQKIKR